MSLLDDVGDAFAGLGELAATATITRVTPGAYVPATGLNATGTTTTCNCVAVLDSTSLKGLGFKFGEGLVQSGDIEALVPAKGLSFDPLPGDIITAAGIQFTVVSVRPAYAGSVAVMFACLVRK